MGAYPLVVFGAATIEIILAGYVFMVNPRGTQNRLFGAGCLLLAEWAFSYAIFAAHRGESAPATWYRAAAAGWTVSTPVLVHFLLATSRRGRLLRKRWFLTLLYAPAVAFLYRDITGPYFGVGFVQSSLGWTALRHPLSLWEVAFFAYAVAASLAGLVSVHLWGRATPHRAERLQARVIVSSGLVSILFAALFQEISVLGALIWVIGIGFAVVRLNLMSLTFETAAHDILRTMGDGIILMGWDRLIRVANPAAARMLGIGQESLIGASITERLPQFSLVTDLTPEHLVPGRSINNVVIELVTPTARPVSLSLSASSVVDRFGESIGVVLMLRDISDLTTAQEKLKFMATHDPLTSLPNRFLLNDRLRMAIASARRHGLPLAVMLLDLDNFKMVNDTLGHSVGDQFLRVIAEEVGHCLRSTDTLARMGGDEFVAVLAEIKSHDDAAEVAKRILAALAEPLHIEVHELFPSASIGISVFPDDGDTVELLLRNADMAMYNVKEASKNGYRFFSESMTEGRYEQLLSPQSLQRALAENQFSVYYQPICDLDSGEVSAAEALLRWHHPERGLLEAHSFIPAAERSGLIIPIGEWVMRTVCEQLNAWRSSGLRQVPVTVNISPRQFQWEGFIEAVSALLREKQVDPSLLIFELTESAAIKDIDKSRQVMGRLVEMGIRIIIDDFGTGYSSLRWLKTVPAFAIKVDKFFVQHAEADADSLAILRAIISMAHSLGLQVIAEGIETEAQAERLRRLDWSNMPSVRCNQVQGYFFARPMTADEFTKSMGPS